MLERDIQKKCLDWCKTQENIVAVKFHQSGWTGRGFPDTHLLIDGVPCYFEFKTPTGTLSKAQKIWRDHIQKAGGFYATPTSVNDFIQDVEIVRRLSNMFADIRNVKQIPTHPAYTQGYLVCPNCQTDLSPMNRHDKYCRECGQALDWSKYNERI